MLSLSVCVRPFVLPFALFFLVSLDFHLVQKRLYGVLRVLEVSRVFKESFKGVSRKFKGSFRKISSKI